MLQQGEWVNPARRIKPLHHYHGVRWITFDEPFIRRARLPRVPCCYVIYAPDGKLLYVGQTFNVRARFAAHRREGLFPKDGYIKIRCGEHYGDWLMREARLIRRLRPPMNARGV